MLFGSTSYRAVFVRVENALCSFDTGYFWLANNALSAKRNARKQYTKIEGWNTVCFTTVTRTHSEKQFSFMAAVPCCYSRCLLKCRNFALDSGFQLVSACRGSPLADSLSDLCECVSVSIPSVNFGWRSYRHIDLSSIISNVYSHRLRRKDTCFFPVTLFNVFENSRRVCCLIYIFQDTSTRDFQKFHHVWK